MLRLGHHIRLTSAERELLEHITGFTPPDVKRLADLRAYVRRCKRHYWGHSRETRELHRLIDEAVAQCVGTADV